MDSQENHLPLSSGKNSPAPLASPTIEGLLSILTQIRLCYPNMTIPESEDELRFYLASWMEWCEGLTTEEMMAAAKAHVRGPDGKWPLTPATLWTAHRELKEIEDANKPRPIMPRRSW